MSDSVSTIRYLKTAASLAFDALREGRLPLSPRRWLINLRHLRSSMGGRGGVMEAPAPPTPDQSAAAVRALVDACQRELATFLRSSDELRFVEHEDPTVSVLLVLHNRAELTLRCLKRLHERLSIPFELIVVDNQSTDDTPAVLNRLYGVTVLPQMENLGFLRACNVAAQAARGRYLLFLNNDTEVQEGSVEAALNQLEGDGTIGAVGGRLVFPDGRLQEAGSIIWSDGSCLGYGRNDSPWAGQYAFVRDVDYCSAAFLLTPRQLFDDLGAFDERYEPAYYEDADYCVRLWKARKRVVYEPRATVTHVEFASSSSASAAVLMQLERRRIFVETHREWLAGQMPPSIEGVLRARNRHRSGQRILMIDDRVPHASIGFGFPRAASVVSTLTDLDHFVTFLPTTTVDEPWERAHENIPPTIEVLQGYGPRRLAEVFRERVGYYDCILVSRSHNMGLLRAKLGRPDQWMPGARVVYDAEAISAVREIGRRRLLGEDFPESNAQRLLAAEVELARGVDAVLTVSDEERRQFEEVAPGRVHVVSHLIEPGPRARSFSERTGFLFVGSFHEMSPNADAVLWFCRRVLPILCDRLAEEVHFAIVGQDPPDEVQRLRTGEVAVVGSVTDLRPLYDAARVFVAPTRFAAGIPFKVGHAAAHGVPVVATSLLARQLEWRHGEELLVADSPEEFASACVALYQDAALWNHVRTGALARVKKDYAHDVFKAALGKALSV
jgi:GT2 family glycosyltransferase/glycosyltransferase involved in cell wall biosynthesis